MTQRNLGCVGDVETSAPREAARRKPTQRATRLGDADVGRIVTIRCVVTGPGSDGWRFVRPIHADGTEGEPLHLPGWWPVGEGSEG